MLNSMFKLEASPALLMCGFFVLCQVGCLNIPAGGGEVFISGMFGAGALGMFFIAILDWLGQI